MANYYYYLIFIIITFHFMLKEGVGRGLSVY